MDAQTIYSLLKPHLEQMESKEKKSLTRLISGSKFQKKLGGRRKVISLAKAKEKLRFFRSQEMLRERG